jgi:Domain of unknown function (DUF4404)
MNDDQLQQLRTLVTDSSDLPESAKSRLLDLVTQAEQQNADASTPNTAAAEFPSAITELEAAHPEATAFLNRIAVTLGNMGI